LGSHSGCCGIWCSGPEEDWVPADYKWGYNRMTTIKGLFTAGDGVGCSGHKFSSGSHAEGRIVAKSMIKYLKDNPGDMVYKPVRTYLDNCDYSTDETVNPHYCKPAGMAMIWFTNPSELILTIVTIQQMKQLTRITANLPAWPCV